MVSFKPELRFPLNRNCGFHSPDRRCNQPRITHFTAKTASHVRKLQEALGKEIVFGRSDVQRVLDLKPTRCTALLREMAEHGIIEPVTGHGKGKYRFRQP